MIGLNFGTWNNGAGFIFIKKRIYLNGYKWTPFIRLSIRYKGRMFWNNLFWGLGLINTD